MEMWQENHREEIVMVDMEQLVPKDHLLRKVEKIMDYKWLYERLSPLYYHDNGRNGTDPVVLIKMVWHSRKFCVSEFRQSQDLWTTDGTVRLTSLVCRTPGGWRGMRALGVNAAAAGREQ